MKLVSSLPEAFQFCFKGFSIQNLITRIQTIITKQQAYYSRESHAFIHIIIIKSNVNDDLYI
jgi:hypothetical protein